MSEIIGTVGDNSDCAIFEKPLGSISAILPIEPERTVSAPEVQEEVGVTNNQLSVGFVLRSFAEALSPKFPDTQNSEDARHRSPKFHSASAGCTGLRKLLSRQRSLSAAAGRTHQLTAALEAYG